MKGHLCFKDNFTIQKGCPLKTGLTVFNMEEVFSYKRTSNNIMFAKYANQIKSNHLLLSKHPNQILKNQSTPNSNQITLTSSSVQTCMYVFTALLQTSTEYTYIDRHIDI